MTGYRRMVAVGTAAVVVFSCLAWHSSNALARKQGGGAKKIDPKRFEAAVAVAKKRLAVAQQRGTLAQQKVQENRTRVESASTLLKSAKQEATSAAAEQKELEAQVEAKENDDSPYSKAKQALAKAERDFNVARDRVFKSAEYLARYRAAMSSPNKATLLPKVRAEAEKNNPDYAIAKENLEFNRKEYDGLRFAMLRNDSNWVDLSKRVREARGQVTEYQRQLASTKVKYAASNSSLRQAVKEAAAAKMAIAKGEAAIKAVNAHNKKAEQQQRNKNRNRGR